MLLTEHQWEISSPDGSVLLVFGTADTGIQTAHSPDLGEQSVAAADAPLAREDGRGFGPEYLNGLTVTFEANVLAEDHVAQADRLDELRGVWAAEEFRLGPQDHAVLRSCVAGRTRRCYGRPRRFAETDADLTQHGYTGVLFDFATIDGKFYDDVEITKQLSLAPETYGGFDGPLSDPISTEVLGAPPGQITVIGQRTWVTVTFRGPVTNPVADFGDFEVGLTGSIADGDSVTIDPRPWSRGVYRADGSSVAGLLTWSTPPLRTLKLKPGTYLVSYRGTDDTATSVCELAWRPAHARP